MFGNCYITAKNYLMFHFTDHQHVFGLHYRKSFFGLPLIFHFTLMNLKLKIETGLDQVQMFKTQKLIRSLTAAEGHGTSLLTLMIPNSTTQLHQMRQKLKTEKGAASNIKNRTNGQSV